MGSYVWTTAEDRFGGFSAIEITDGGTGFLALSDRGAYVRGRIERSDGVITGILAGNVTLLRGDGDHPLPPYRADSEGLALAPDGTAYVSFEGVARVSRYATIDGPEHSLPDHPDFEGQQNNSAFEALALGPEGTLYAIPERSGRVTRPFPVYRFQNGAWDSVLQVPRSDSFLPVAADIGADGRFYLLERQFNGPAGFASRLRRFDLTPDALINERRLLQTPSGLHDNLEGLSIWRDGTGTLRATMISDDNFSRWQVTELVEYQLPD